MSTLLEDLLSKDPTRTWAASGAVVHLRDPQELDQLAQNLSEIRRETRGVALGGMMFPNSEHLRFVLRKLKYHHDRVGCLCRLYPEYLMYDPNDEAAAGNVRIENTIYLQDKWVDAYLCACTLCGARYRVEEREYHYTWWGWKALDEQNVAAKSKRLARRLLPSTRARLPTVAQTPPDGVRREVEALSGRKP